MKVSDLRNGTKVDSIELKVVEKEEPRDFTSRYGSTGKVCNATGEDETGQIKLTLWGDDIEKVDVNQKIKITNGYVREWNGELQLSAGKYGKLEVLE